MGPLLILSAVLAVLSGCATVTPQREYIKETLEPAVIKDYKKFLQCYTDHVKADKQGVRRDGEVSLVFDIHPANSGSGPAEIKNTQVIVDQFARPQLTDCLFTELRALKLPAAESGKPLQLNYTFRFLTEYKKPDPPEDPKDLL